MCRSRTSRTQAGSHRWSALPIRHGSRIGARCGSTINNAKVASVGSIVMLCPYRRDEPCPCGYYGDSRRACAQDDLGRR